MGATAAPRGGAEGEKCKHIGVNTHTNIYTDVCAADLVLEKSVQVESVNKCKVNTHRLKYFTDGNWNHKHWLKKDSGTCNPG